MSRIQAPISRHLSGNTEMAGKTTMIPQTATAYMMIPEQQQYDIERQYYFRHHALLPRTAQASLGMRGDTDNGHRYEVYTKGSCRKIGGKGADDEDDIDFDDIKWGKFTDQLNRYNSQNKKDLDLCQFADLILSNPKKYTMTTQRRARFYKNVLAKKKC